MAAMADGTEVGVWYPGAGQAVSGTLGLYEQTVVAGGAPVGSHLPLVVISHGSGGSFADHLDVAGALARSGFVVAALTHPGDNWRDHSRATDVADRPAALRRLIDFMLLDWRFHDRIDPTRIGAFGFSAGGLTVLVAAGGRPDLSRVGPHCAAYPAFFDCVLLRSHPVDPKSGAFVPDGRIRAVVVAAPALGFTFDRAGLRAVRVPVQLWRAGADRILPAPFYADAVRAALPSPPEFHDVPGAGHLDFLAPCAAWVTAPAICASAPGFDRAAFHRELDAAVVAFF
jgi:predicted dienelactone hydrolase